MGCLVQRLVLQQLYAPRWAHSASSGASDCQQEPALLLTGVMECALDERTIAHNHEAAAAAAST